MKDNMYHNAVSHLRFSDHLEEAVLKKAKDNRPKYRVLRTAVLAAVICVLLVGTAFASGSWLVRNLKMKEIGQIHEDLSGAEVMEFTAAESREGIELHYMQIRPNVQFSFQNGMLYSKKEGFFRLTEDYDLEPLEYRSLEADFNKNNRDYTLRLQYVEAEEGIYSETCYFYPEENGEILICFMADGNALWPVYLHLQTGTVRDALPGFDETSFCGRVVYAQPFRDGILVTTLDESQEQNHLYWIAEGSNACMELELPAGRNYISGDSFYYKDRSGNLYVLDDAFDLQPMEHIPDAADDPTKGLLTVRNADGTLGIVDLPEQAQYNISNINATANEVGRFTGYNATRHSLEGKIILTHSYRDWEEDRACLDSIALLDVKAGQLKQVILPTEYHVLTHGWLDDDRYGVIYEEGFSRYLCIFEFIE